MTSTYKQTRTPKLGQHLLTSVSIARAVCDAVSVEKGDTVLEIGPGKGMLTRELLLKGASVVAVEKDPAMIDELEAVFPEEIKNKKLHLIHDDARSVLQKLPIKTSYKVVANIPYYITGELIRLCLTNKSQPTDISLLVQKEVAERIARSKKETLLSLSVKAYGTPEYVRTVKSGSFNPPPKVDSAILAIHHISRKNFKDVSEDTFFELLHIGFGQKRKTLLGNISKDKDSVGTMDRTKLSLLFQKVGIDVKARGEDLPLETWLKLVKKL